MELEADDLLETDCAAFDPTLFNDSSQVSAESTQQESGSTGPPDLLKNTSEFDPEAKIRDDFIVPATVTDAKNSVHRESCPVSVEVQTEGKISEDNISEPSTISSCSSEEERTEEDMLADLLKMSTIGQHTTAEDSSPPPSEQSSKLSGLEEEKERAEGLPYEAERKVKKRIPGRRGPKSHWHASKSYKTGMDSYKCEVCLNEFSSRNQLFKHIKSTGHAIIKSK